MRIDRQCLAVPLIGLSTWLTATGVVAAELAWEADGFVQPESARYDPDAGVIYVTNLNGGPMDKNGQGFISRVSPEGEVLELEWVTGLNAPKGLGLHQGKLYVADIDQLVTIDVASGKVEARHDGPDAQFLNDVTVHESGRVFVSDMVGSAIYVLDGDEFGVWLADPALEHPNGLYAEADRIVIGAWGVMTDGFATKVPGHLKAISLEGQEISSFGGGEPVGNLDGVEADGEGRYLVTDWMAGGLFRIDGDGQVETIQDFEQGSADIGYLSDDRVVVIPLMSENRVVALRVE